MHGVGGMGLGDLGASCPGGAVVPWWLSGGIAAVNCRAAYTPKGAANLAASYDNNAAPGNGLPDGTYDATLGVAPLWAAATGWTGTGASWLRTGIIPAAGWSAIAYATFTTGVKAPFGGDDAANARFVVVSDFAGGDVFYANGGFVVVAGGGHLGAGSIGIAGQQGYWNGAPQGGAIPAWAGVGLEIYLVANNIGGSNWYSNYPIVAIAIYNTILTAPQMLALTTAMAAL